MKRVDYVARDSKARKVIVIEQFADYDRWKRNYDYLADERGR